MNFAAPSNFYKCKMRPPENLTLKVKFRKSQLLKEKENFGIAAP